MGIIKEFLGIGGYQRTPEGAMSWQHLLFVSSLMVAMIGLGVFLGIRNKHRDEKTKNLVLIISAIAINAVEIFKIVTLCIRSDGDCWGVFRTTLPLFLCSIQLIAIPVAAFARGRIKEAALDFVFIFGMLGGVLGTFGAFQNYNAYPVLSMDNVASGLTHTISGFASLYIGVSGMASMKLKNLPITYGILFTFCAAAMTANFTLDYNYMFLRNHDGTPYVMFYNMVGGNPVLYPMVVILLFVIYIAIFCFVFHLVKSKGAIFNRAKKSEACEAASEDASAVEAATSENTTETETVGV